MLSSGGADLGMRETVNIVKWESSTGKIHRIRLALAGPMSNVLGMHNVFVFPGEREFA